MSETSKKAAADGSQHGLVRRFRDWNEQLSLNAFVGLFIRDDLDVRNAVRRAPYVWMLLLIPIAGIAFFYGVIEQESINRKRRELEERRNRMLANATGSATKGGQP